MSRFKSLILFYYLLFASQAGAQDFSRKSAKTLKPLEVEKPKVLIREAPKPNPEVAVGVSGQKVFKFSEQSFYSLYDEFLKEYIESDGQLVYSGITANPRVLDKFLAVIENFPKEVFDELGEQQKIAFWINTYNAFMIKVVADHFPIKKYGVPKLNQNFPANSVRQIPGAWNGIKRIIMGKVLTLQDIEQNILRKEFNEPRIHLALVKASKSSPVLLSEPYMGSTLEAQLSEQSKAFLRDPSRFFIEKEDRKIRLSPIFDWYSKDFSRKYPLKGGFNRYPKEYASVLQFISRYVSDEDAEFLEKKAIKVFYLEYDWRLNDVNVPKILQEEHY